MWDNGTITPLTIAGITNPTGIDIDDHGNVVVEALAGLDRRSYLWEDGVVTDLGTLGDWAVATKMNSNRQIIGWSHINGVSYAFLWNDGNLQNLGRNSAMDINDAGQIGGTFNGVPGIWSNGQVTPIAKTSPYQFIYGINNQGDTTGFAWFFNDYPTYLHAYVANVSEAKDLGSINGLNTWAGEINDDGVVVGYAWATGIQRAFFTKDGVTSLLDDKLPPDSGWETLYNAIDINNAGQILGQGSKNGTRQNFVMSGACLQ